jgi:hypothetical protein
MVQEAVLLRAVEAVDLVHEEQGALAAAPPAGRLLEGAFEVGHAREHRRELHEGQAGPRRQQACDGGLARARRPPEDEAGKRAQRQHARKRAVRTEQMVLPHHLLERSRPQPVGERTGRARWGGGSRRRGAEQVGGGVLR